MILDACQPSILCSLIFSTHLIKASLLLFEGSTSTYVTCKAAGRSSQPPPFHGGGQENIRSTTTAGLGPSACPGGGARTAVGHRRRSGAWGCPPGSAERRGGGMGPLSNIVYSIYIYIYVHSYIMLAISFSYLIQYQSISTSCIYIHRYIICIYIHICRDRGTG